jgi:hypothetical protein
MGTVWPGRGPEPVKSILRKRSVPVSVSRVVPADQLLDEAVTSPQPSQPCHGPRPTPRRRRSTGPSRPLWPRASASNAKPASRTSPRLIAPKGWAAFLEKRAPNFGSA